MRGIIRLPLPFVLLALHMAGTSGANAIVCSGISETSATPLTTVRITDGLVRPLFVTAPPDDVNRLFVVQQDGVLRLLVNGALQPTPFLDISALVFSPADLGGGNEEGLLGLAFDPEYAATGWFFVYHTNLSGNNVIARYTRSLSDANVADPNSRQVVLTLTHQPDQNHNGGMLAFGPNDGYLYIGTGDGGSGCDPTGNAQNPTSNLGKLLRIDVSSLPYSIPPTNPFGPAGDPAGQVNDEIWALGMRNPWRYSFAGPNAPQPGDLYVGDVGQMRWEEIDYQPASSGGGENYGWDLYEGLHCPNPSCGSATCVVPGNVLPVLEFDHMSTSSCSVTGGYVYQGCRMPALRGRYFYSDYCSSFIKTFRIVGGAVTDPNDLTTELAPGGGMDIREVTSFGEDARGEMYIVDRGGEVYKIVPVLSNLEVSGQGAAPFLLAPSDWSWEDLKLTSSHPITSYRVYRSIGNGSGVFSCVHQGPLISWAGGDPSVPPPGGLFTYLVTAQNAGGLQTSSGFGTGGTPHTLSAAACLP